MARRGVLSIDATCVTLLWAPVVVLCASLAAGLRGLWLLSLTGLTAALCTYIYAVAVAGPRPPVADGP